MSENLEVAETIYQQLGGNKFAVMTGCKSFVADKDSLKFRIPRNASKANMCKIKLNAMDYYDVQFIQHRPARFLRKSGKYISDSYETVKEFENVDCTGLVEVFESFTGLYTRL